MIKNKLVKFLLAFSCITIFSSPSLTYATEEAEIISEDNNASLNSELEVKETDTESEDKLYDEILQLQWINISSPKMLLFELNENNTFRYEIFYSTGTPAPEILLVSPSGYIYKKDAEENSLLTIKQNLSLPDRTDIKYTVIYISSNESGTWKLSVTPNGKEKFLCVVQTETPKNWNSIKKETPLQPEEIISWHLDETVYAIDDIKDVIKARSEEEFSKGIQSTTEIIKEQEEVKDNSNSFIILTVIICIIIVIVSYFSKKKKEEIAEKKKQKRIEEANNALAEERAKENERLEEMMMQYEGEYIDYPENVNYYADSIEKGIQRIDIKHISNVPQENIEVENNKAEDLKTQTDTATSKKEDDNIVNYF